MRSIKPGRGPSMMGAVGAIGAAIFGVFWIGMAISMGAPIIFPAFGVIFIGMAIAQAVYNYKNATSKNRYSAFDITDEQEEEDPLNKYFGEKNPYKNQYDSYTEHKEEGPTEVEKGESKFCPYCGAKVEGDYTYCNKCGKKLP